MLRSRAALQMKRLKPTHVYAVHPSHLTRGTSRVNSALLPSPKSPTLSFQKEKPAVPARHQTQVEM